VTARPPKCLAQLHGQRFTCLRLHFAEAPVKDVRTDTIWQPTIQRQLGVTMYGGSYVDNLFKGEVVSHKNVLFPTVTLHNNLFCHRLSDHLHCTNCPFTYVLRKDLSVLSRRSKSTPFRKNFLNEISRKSTKCKAVFAMASFRNSPTQFFKPGWCSIFSKLCDSLNT